MHISVIGALTGLALAVVVFLFDYMMVSRTAAERAKRYNRKQELDPTEVKGLKSLAQFCVLLPPGFALAFWILWG